MKKILYRNVMLEITRRCQLKCEHCLRGDAQDIDMSEEIIDAFLEQTAGIECLFFTGGEPTLAVDKMWYVLEKMIEKNIPLYSMAYITNGVEFTKLESDFLVEAYKYIEKCRETTPIFDLDPKMKVIHIVNVGISLDNFHTGVDFEFILSQYRRLCSKMPLYHVGYINNDIPGRVGRGKKLEYAFSYSQNDIEQNSAIGIAEKWKDVACDDYFNCEEIFERCDAFIPCTIYVTAKGAIASEHGCNEYTETDDVTKHICKIENKHFPSIVDAIKRFNAGRLPCYLTNYVPKRITLDDVLALMCYKKTYSIDTDTNLFNRPGRSWLPLEKYIQLVDTLITQRDRHVSLYKAYLLTRVSEYDTIEEIRKDFPQSNSLFYHDVLNMRESFYFPKHFVDWICDNKDKVKYRVEDDLIPLSSQIALLRKNQTHNNRLLLDALLSIKKQRKSSDTIENVPACR